MSTTGLAVVGESKRRWLTWVAKYLLDESMKTLIGYCLFNEFLFRSSFHDLLQFSALVLTIFVRFRKLVPLTG